MSADRVQTAEEFAGVLLVTESPKYAKFIRARDAAIVEVAARAVCVKCVCYPRDFDPTIQTEHSIECKAIRAALRSLVEVSG